MSVIPCPLCRTRKGRRSCPALNQVICPACCGSKRLTEIACPPSCPYLSSARAHPPAVVQRRQERDLQFMLPLLASLREEQVELFVIFQAGTVGHARKAIPPLLDADVAEAAAAVAATLETAGKGIIYEHQATSVPARRLAEEFREIVRDLQQRARGASRVPEKDLAAALRCLERAARTAAAGLEGDEPPVYLGLARRMTEQVAAGRADGADGPEPEDEPRLILP